MRPLRSLMFYALAVFVGGALLGPWLSWLAQAAADTWPQCRELAGKPLHRYVLRAMMLIALFGLWPLLRGLGAHSWRDVGLTPWQRVHWSQLGGGMALGFGTLAGAAGLALVCGGRELDGGLTGAWWGRLPGIAGTAVIIGTLEELIYRGALYGGLRRACDWRIALVSSSALYAGMHFLRNVESPVEAHWWSGLALLPRMLAGWMRPELLLPGFVGLMLTGMVLALAYQRTGHLHFSIGLHIGWVFWLRSYNFMTDRRPDAAEWLWGTGKLYDGWIALAALAVAGVIVWKLGQPQPFDTDARQPA